ncbi:hypothetical protein BD779DRAFT_1465841 [Infundibulicybe gibba]|nr:hypothetical protein BD779DRAFT_1465841 [Infundibulicybe gibba]
MTTQSTEVDVETLQAQIDLSMSFADNLISSWIKPSLNLPTRSQNIESELQEYMRRPTRLGVGAKIPQTTSHWREAGSLKAKLNAKVTREEDAVLERGDEDPEESRTGAIKKRAMADPFGEDTRKKKKRKRHTVNHTSPTTNQIERNTVKVISPSPLLIKKPKPSDKNVQPPVEDEPIADHGAESSIEQEPIDISLTSTPTTSPRKESGPGVARVSSPSIRVQPPLLNLHGPPETDPANTNGIQSHTKNTKKRRRRKKDKKIGKTIDGGN